MKGKGERRSESPVVTTQSVIDISDESLAIEGAQRTAANETSNSVRGGVLDGEVARVYGYRFHARFYAQLPSDVK